MSERPRIFRDYLGEAPVISADMRRVSCFFTGHRDFAPDDASSDLLSETVDSLIRLGVTHFYAGGARGFDTFAEITVLNRRLKNPSLTLTLALRRLPPRIGQDHEGALRGDHRHLRRDRLSAPGILARLLSGEEHLHGRPQRILRVMADTAGRRDGERRELRQARGSEDNRARESVRERPGSRMTLIRGKNHGRTIPYSASSHSEGAELFLSRRQALSPLTA